MWETFLSQPITQVGASTALLLGLHKSGLFDVRLLLRSMLGIEPAGQEHPSLGDSINLLLNQMKELAGYYNHDTTERYKNIQETLEALEKTATETKHLLQEFKEYGIKVRNE